MSDNIITQHSKLSLIERGPIVARALAYFPFESRNHARRPTSGIWTSSRGSQASQGLVAGEACPGKRNSQKLRGRGGTRTAQHRAGQHMQAGGGFGGNACGVNAILVATVAYIAWAKSIYFWTTTCVTHHNSGRVNDRFSGDSVEKFFYLLLPQNANHHRGPTIDSFDCGGNGKSTLEIGVLASIF